MSIISSKLKLVKPSPTLAVTAKAAELKRKGENIISLGAGEPDFDTPDHIKEAAIRAIQGGKTKYTAAGGTPELKKAVCNKFKSENGLEYTEKEVIICAGGKQVIYNLFAATLNPGDEVIIPAPYWVSYPDIILLNDGTPVIVNSTEDTGFKLSASEIEKAITPRTKWLILNSPSNPTGSAYYEEELLEIAAVLRSHPHVNIMCDDIYEHIVFEGFKFKSLAALCPDLRDRIFIVNGVSKTYSMTGWRIGYGVGAKHIIDAMTVVQSQSTSNPCSISQAAAVAALDGPQDYIKVNTANFEKKRDLVLNMLAEIPNISCYKPQGAFYLFPKCAALFGKKTPAGGVISSSNDLGAYLLESAGVAVVPGIAFGSDEYFRISYATSETILREAVLRIKAAVERLA